MSQEIGRGAERQDLRVSAALLLRPNEQARPSDQQGECANDKYSQNYDASKHPTVASTGPIRGVSCGAGNFVCFLNSFPPLERVLVHCLAIAHHHTGAASAVVM
jgi:hypothetical protein